MRYFLTPVLFMVIGFTASAQITERPQNDTSYSAADLAFLAEQDALNSTCPQCTGKSRPPFTIIGSGLAEKRMKNYQKKISDCGLHLVPYVKYSINGAISLVNKLIAASYDGYRAYFAVYPSKQANATDSGYNLVPTDQDGKLTLIYVPTSPGGIYIAPNGKKYAVHIDDTLNAMIVKDDNYKIISPKYASMWIHKAALQVLDTMERWQHVYGHRKNFLETHSLWYDDRYVRHNKTYQNSLWDILQYKKCCFPNSQVYAKFAAFSWSNLEHYPYKLSIVFQVKSGKNSQFVSLFSYDRSHWAKYAFKAEYKAAISNKAILSNQSGSDTGKPCPPPNPCGTNVGSLLN